MEFTNGTTDVRQLAREWLRLDKDPDTRSEIQDLLGREDVDELEKRLRNRIKFGTAGLRARMEAGFSRMNSLTVIQASQGLAEYLLRTDDDARAKGVVIGRDARFNSRKFAELTASTFHHKGFNVYYMGLVHTPLVPFAITYHKAIAGVMVTASHNPAKDNGYKVYMSNGCQIIPPIDSLIATSIEQNLEPLTWETDHIHYDTPRILDGLKGAGGSYMQAVCKHSMLKDIARRKETYRDSRVKFAYTPMHGVGLHYFKELLGLLGLADDMHVVKSQAVPDPTFPTVPFPNPEEQGALQEAMDAAIANGIRFVFANDPDADRFTAAQLVDGNWIQFTGNQIGQLLASFLLETLSDEDGDIPRAMLVSAVSSRMLFKMGKEWNDQGGEMTVTETLTGFKWLGNKAREFEKTTGGKVIFAYEEAIGYMIPGVVFDKDGIAAAALFLAMCITLEHEGYTPWDKLQELYKTYGYHREANTYVISPSPEITNEVFTDIRASNPAMVGPWKISRCRDMTLGFDSGTEDLKPTLPVDTSSQMITCELEEDIVFTVRGSGTEPKIKIYIEASSRESADVAELKAQSVLRVLLAEWLKPEKYGLRVAGS